MPTVRAQFPTILTSTKSGISSNASSTRSSTFAGSPPDTTRPSHPTHLSSLSQPAWFGCDECPHDLVWRFRSPHHSCGELYCGLLNQSHTRIKGLLVSFDSEIRTRACRTMKRISESRH